MSYLKHFALNFLAGTAAAFSLLLLVLGWSIMAGSVEPYLFVRDNWRELLVLSAIVVLGYANEMAVRRTRGS